MRSRFRCLIDSVTPCRRNVYSMKCLLFLLLALSHLQAQTSPTPVQPVWEGVPDICRNLDFPEIQIPDTQTEWETKKPEIRRILYECLGEIPARPSQQLTKPHRTQTESIVPAASATMCETPPSVSLLNR